MSDTILLSVSQLQGHYNNAKELILDKINADLNLKIDPNDYIFVTRQKGALGKLWDKVFGTPEESKAYIQLLKVEHERSENIDNDVSAS